MCEASVPFWPILFLQKVAGGSPGFHFRQSEFLSHIATTAVVEDVSE
jgi:hypothetical protein